jgi:hypothetical protein
MIEDDETGLLFSGLSLDELIAVCDCTFDTPQPGTVVGRVRGRGGEAFRRSSNGAAHDVTR